MARRGGEGGGAGPMNTIIGGFVGLLVIVAIVILGPTLAGSIEAATPALGATSSWNATYNTNLPTGDDLWTQNVTIGGVVILVFFIALAILSELGIGTRFKNFTSSIQALRLHPCDRITPIASMYPFGGSVMKNSVVMLG